MDLLDSFSKNINDSDRKAAMDQAFRDKLLELLTEEAETLENYVCFCIESCRRQMVTPTMPVVLLGDIFDALTLNKCEKMFTYVENGVNIWKEELFFVACKNNLLRMCNDLLRRLSRSQNTVFCGRILLFLAKFFPFSERSGLNIVSEFNLENVTEFGGDNSSNLKDSLDEEMMVEEEKTKLNIDYNLYCRFWSLQDFFRNPNTCYNKIQWKTFVAVSILNYTFTSTCTRSNISLFCSENYLWIQYLTARLGSLLMNTLSRMGHSTQCFYFYHIQYYMKKLLVLGWQWYTMRRDVIRPTWWNVW